MIDEMGVGSDFWSDASCIQCRAERWLSDPDLHNRTIREYTDNGASVQLLRSMVSREEADKILEDAVRVGYRKGRAELRVIMLDDHECGKARQSTDARQCGLVFGLYAPCSQSYGHTGFHDMIYRVMP